MNATNKKQTSNKTASNKTVNVPAKVIAPANKPVLTPEQKQAAKAAAAEKHYQTQLAALIAAGIPQDVAEKALAALKPVHVAKAGNVTVTEIEEMIIKMIISRAKMYNGAQSTATEYTIEPVVHQQFSSFYNIQAKIAEKISYFKPNASKTGKACLTDDKTCQKIIEDGYLSLIDNLMHAIPADVYDSRVMTLTGGKADNPAADVPADEQTVEI